MKVAATDVVSTRSGTLRVLREQLDEAAAAARCHPCGCFHDLVAALRRDVVVRGEVAEAFAAAEASLAPRSYDCLGCTVCYPAVAANALADAGLGPTIDACPTAPPADREGWPPLPGDYRVIRFRAPVAVCTLNSVELFERLGGLGPNGLSIVGTLRTENLGIERIIRNVLGDPHIRFLVLCGEDAEGAVGHLPGQSLECLFANGLDERMRILGARGRRPVLRNLGPEHVAAFRKQVELVSLVGEARDQVILDAVAACVDRDPGPAVAAFTDCRVETIRAAEPEHLALDPAGYLVVHPDRSRRLLVVEHYSNGGALDLVVEGATPGAVWSEVLARGLVSRLDHAAYLGRELARAEESLATGERYVQDAAPGRVGSGDPESCGCGTTCPEGGAA